MNNENTVTKVVQQVTSRKDAEAVVAKLLEYYVGETAWTTVEAKANERKQSVGKFTRQTVRNLFTTFSTNRYSK